MYSGRRRKGHQKRALPERRRQLTDTEAAGKNRTRRLSRAAAALQEPVARTAWPGEHAWSRRTVHSSLSDSPSSMAVPGVTDWGHPRYGRIVLSGRALSSRSTRQLASIHRGQPPITKWAGALPAEGRFARAARMDRHSPGSLRATAIGSVLVDRNALTPLISPACRL